jgi:predicted 2-oxoglutarate/Fe(II)-dependent dioxygenase YbiX
MFLPMQNKPSSSADYEEAILEIPNIIDKELAEQLKSFSLNAEVSGRHRRGSKTPNVVQASFYTCLVFQHNSPVYKILDPVWEQFCINKNPNITFLEPYEIKSYVKDDCFGAHNDILVSKNRDVERKVNLIVQLSDGDEYEGGDLMVGAVKCSRKFGTGIFFPARYVHSVTTITNGERYSLIGHAWGPLSK